MTTVLLHGALGAKSQLEPLRTRLIENGVDALSMNLSGHSGEPFSNTGFGIEVFAEDVKRFLDGHGKARVNMFGYSMGGYVALWFAYLYPERVNSIIALGTKFDWDERSAEQEVKKVNPDKIQEKVPAFARLLQHRHAPNDWHDVLHKTAVMMRGLGKTPLLTENILKKINIPVVIALGDQDDMADRKYSEQVASWLPRGRFVIMEDTVHAIEKVDLPKLTSLF